MAGTSSPAPFSAPSTEARWAGRQSPDERAALVEAYTPLVRYLAGRVYGRRRAPDLQFADLVQQGMLGLLEAIDRYTPARGVRFESFAYQRIEGAILDGLDAYSEVHRQLQVRRIQARLRAESLREEANAPEASALESLADLAVGLALGFAIEDSGMLHDPEAALPDNAYARTELAQLRRQLAELVRHLPEQERRIVYRHYFQQQAFDQVALALGLSRGRVSQLHQSGLRRLRELLRQTQGLDTSG